jgi:hypothetical protein
VAQDRGVREHVRQLVCLESVRVPAGASAGKTIIGSRSALVAALAE